MTESADERELIESCRAGRVDAFGILVARYQDRLYPTALRLTGHPDDALDVLQDAFLRAFEKLGKFKGESSFYTWVYRITVNLALSQRRKRRVVGRQAGELGDPADDATRSDPSRPLDDFERDQFVQMALNALAPEHRAVVVMKEFDGLKYEEIAVTLNIPVGTVRSRLHRARLELRDRLKNLVEFNLPTTQQSPTGESG